MNEEEEHLTTALPGPEISVHTDGTEEFSTSHEIENTRGSSRPLSTQNEDSLARDSVRFNALVDLLATDGPSLGDQYQGEDTAEVIHHPSALLTSSGLPLLAQRPDPFRTPEHRPNILLPVQPLIDPTSSVQPALPHGRLSPTVSPLVLPPRTLNREGSYSPLETLRILQRSSPSQVTRGLPAPPPPADVSATAPSFTETHGIVHSTPALAPTYERPITHPSSSRQFHWAHQEQEQLDVMARSLVNAKAESEALKRKCAKLQQTIDQLRENTTLQSDEEGELTRSTGRGSRKDHLRFMDADAGLYVLPSESHEAAGNLTLPPNLYRHYASGDYPRLSTRSPHEIERALAMVERIDELVYKRKALSRAPASSQQIYSEENVEGLFRRVEIWERAARSLAPPPW